MVINDLNLIGKTIDVTLIASSEIDQLRKNKINHSFTSFGILNKKYKIVSNISSKLVKDKITIYKR